MTWKLDKPYGGYNVGQLLGFIQADKENLTKKEQLKRNFAMGISALLGGVDTRARAKQTNVVNTLNQSKVTDIAKSSKMYDEAEALQTVEESINKYGGGLDGALIHYDPEAELLKSGLLLLIPLLSSLEDSLLFLLLYYYPSVLFCSLLESPWLLCIF